jgi:hypothetical protein
LNRKDLHPNGSGAEPLFEQVLQLSRRSGERKPPDALAVQLNGGAALVNLDHAAGAMPHLRQLGRLLNWLGSEPYRRTRRRAEKLRFDRK